MSSLSKVLLHIVFSTKHRKKIIDPNIDQELYAYIAQICLAKECKAIAINGVEDHIHIASRLSRNISIAQLLCAIKANSSRWIKQRFPHMSHFRWQNGYGAFSLGFSQIDTLVHYIERQKQHHHKTKRPPSYKTEVRALIKKYNVEDEVDERYLWD